MQHRSFFFFMQQYGNFVFYIFPLPPNAIDWMLWGHTPKPVIILKLECNKKDWKTQLNKNNWTRLNRCIKLLLTIMFSIIFMQLYSYFFFYIIPLPKAIIWMLWGHTPKTNSQRKIVSANSYVGVIKMENLV